MLDTPLAQVENLAVTFETRDGPVTAVAGLSFEVYPGETLCIVGESGSGKSVAALALMRLVEFGGGQITGGRVMFRRQEAGQDTPQDLARAEARLMREIRGHHIGMVFQEPMTALNPVFTIERQLTEGLRLHKKLGKRAARARALELLEEVRLPEPARRLRQYPHELSGGQRQRVMIAMALACAPRLIIADEPTTALDVTTQAEILALLTRLKDETGTALIFITHDMAVVAQMADRVVVMQAGRKVEEGPVAQVFSAPRAAYTKALLAAVPRLGEMRGTAAPAPMRLPGARARQHETAHASSTPEAPPLLQVEGLTTRYPVRGGLMRRVVAQVHAVEDVSFTLRQGQTLALVGESGCGKSTTGRSVLRLEEPLRGRVRLLGEDIMALSPQGLRRARQRMQMIFQDPVSSLDPQMSLMAQVIEPMQNYQIGTRAEQEARAAELFDRVHLPRGLLRRYPHELSGGQRQRVAIARALALSPRLIVADEAVSALDVSVQAQVLNLMMELQGALGLSYLFISHDMAVVERVAHEVAVMHRGRIVERGPRSAIFERPQHPYTKALLAAVPVADPALRPARPVQSAAPLPSPIHPVGHAPGASQYREVGPGHVVLSAPDLY